MTSIPTIFCFNKKFTLAVFREALAGIPINKSRKKISDTSSNISFYFLFRTNPIHKVMNPILTTFPDTLTKHPVNGMRRWVTDKKMGAISWTNHSPINNLSATGSSTIFFYLHSQSIIEANSNPPFIRKKYPQNTKWRSHEFSDFLAKLLNLCLVKRVIGLLLDVNQSLLVKKPMY